MFVLLVGIHSEAELELVLALVSFIVIDNRTRFVKGTVIRSRNLSFI